MIQIHNLINNIFNHFIKKHYVSLFLITFLINLPAVFFAKGYGMHDDHFGPIEQPWAIINNPQIWEERTTPHSHSIFYPLLHYILFKLLYSIGITDPQDMMLIVRFLHSLFSTLTIIFIYKILVVFYEKHIAFLSALLLPFLWFMPFFSVRNLIEMVCIPPLAIGFYFLIKENRSNKDLILSGLAFAFAFAFRYHTLFISGSIILILIYYKEYKNAFVFALSLLLFILLVQGSVDVFAWGYPLASFIEYTRYNLTHSGDYVTGPFYRYLLLFVGIFIPPLSILILINFFKGFKNKLIVLLPVLIFFLFHSIFPNKQERFILPIVPFVFTFGTSSILAMRKSIPFNKSKEIIYRSIWAIFWTINIPLLIIFSLNYGKKTRCESLYYLSKKPDVVGILQITGKFGTFKPPEFYLNKYGTPIYEIANKDSLISFIGNKRLANYAIIYGEEIDSLKKMTEEVLNNKLVYETQIKPSLADYILYKLNPRYNKNQVATIFRIQN